MHTPEHVSVTAECTNAQWMLQYMNQSWPSAQMADASSKNAQDLTTAQTALENLLAFFQFGKIMLS